MPIRERDHFELFKKELFSGLKIGITAWSTRVASRLNQNTPISRSRGTFGVQPFKQEGSTLKGGIGTSFSEPGALYAFELGRTGGKKIHPTSTGGVFAVPLENLKIPKFLGPGALGPGTPQRDQEINIPVAKRSEQKIFFRSYTLGTMIARPFIVPAVRALKRKVVEDLKAAVKVTIRGVR